MVSVQKGERDRQPRRTTMTKVAHAPPLELGRFRATLVSRTAAAVCDNSSCQRLPPPAPMYYLLCPVHLVYRSSHVGHNPCWPNPEPCKLNTDPPPHNFFGSLLSTTASRCSFDDQPPLSQEPTLLFVGGYTDQGASFAAAILLCSGRTLP